MGCLKSAGTVPVRRVELIMDNTRGSCVKDVFKMASGDNVGVTRRGL